MTEHPDLVFFHSYAARIAQNFYGNKGDWQPAQVPHGLAFKAIETAFLHNPGICTNPTDLGGEPELAYRFLRKLGFTGAAYWRSGTSAHVYAGYNALNKKIYALRIPQMDTEHPAHFRADVPMAVKAYASHPLLGEQCAHSIEVLPFLPVISFNDPGAEGTEPGFNIVREVFAAVGVPTGRARDFAVLPDLTILVADPDNYTPVWNFNALSMKKQRDAAVAHAPLLAQLTDWEEVNEQTGDLSPKRQRYFKTHNMRVKV